jgi:hypothetical protein
MENRRMTRDEWELERTLATPLGQLLHEQYTTLRRRLQALERLAVDGAEARVMLATVAVRAATTLRGPVEETRGPVEETRGPVEETGGPVPAGAAHTLFGRVQLDEPRGAGGTWRAQAVRSDGGLLGGVVGWGGTPREAVLALVDEVLKVAMGAAPAGSDHVAACQSWARGTLRQRLLVPAI